MTESKHIKIVFLMKNNKNNNNNICGVLNKQSHILTHMLSFLINHRRSNNKVERIMGDCWRDLERIYWDFYENLFFFSMIFKNNFRVQFFYNFSFNFKIQFKWHFKCKLIKFRKFQLIPKTPHWIYSTYPQNSCRVYSFAIFNIEWVNFHKFSCIKFFSHSRKTPKIK